MSSDTSNAPDAKGPIAPAMISPVAETNKPLSPLKVDESGQTIERRIVRKFDFSIMPLVFCLYLVAFLDRSNIGNAKTAGMSADLEIDDRQFQVRQNLSAYASAAVDSLAIPSGYS